jgi:hypothetical protein
VGHAVLVDDERHHAGGAVVHRPGDEREAARHLARGQVLGGATLRGLALALEYATAERLAVLAAVREERIAMAAVLHDERIETMKEVDAIKTLAVDSAMLGLRGLIDYALCRVIAALALLLAIAAALGVVAYRFTIANRPRVAR